MLFSSSLYPKAVSGVFKKPLHLVCLMLFFWTLFDGIVSYMTPIAINKSGFSETIVGIIIGSSSIAGAFFDFILSKYINNTHFRRIYLLMFAFSFLTALVLWQAKAVWMFLIAMSMWGFYYDLENFGNFDYVGRKADEDDHSGHFGIMIMFKELGYMLAPLFAGLVLGQILDWKPFILMIFFLGISFLFYLLLVGLTQYQRKEYIEPTSIKPHNLFLEIGLWEKIGKLIFPVLLLTTLLNVLDSFFWTLGPIMAENFADLHPFNGLFMVAYTLPPLFMGWIVGFITNEIGKKRTAFISFIVGSMLLSLFVFVHNPLSIIGIVFLSSCLTSLAWPSINGAYADYLSEAPRVEKEIEALEDFFSNVGYIVGPMIAGFLADRVGNALTFSLLGICGCIFAFLFMRITPKHIKIPNTTRV